MALMFQRLARNFIKNGYFPTDAETTARVLAAIEPSDRPMRILDPCCGEGVALAETAAWLGGGETGLVEAYGVEYDAERAWHAKQLLDRVLHADLMDTVVQPRGFGLLWLNPPYGDLVGDQIGASAVRWKGRKRLEKLFYERTVGTLQWGGVMVLIVPHYALDREFAGWIARHFQGVRVFRAATDQYKQVVVLGIRQRSGTAADGRIRDELTAAGQGDLEPPPLPESWAEPRYTVPPAGGEPPRFFSLRLDARQLAAEIASGPCLWDRFEVTFQRGARAHRRPLRALSRWHLALALAAGQIAGVVRSEDGRQLLVKGDTYKEKAATNAVESDGDGGLIEVRTLTDRFVPVIRAIDLTPGSERFGDVLTIR